MSITVCLVTEIYTWFSGNYKLKDGTSTATCIVQVTVFARF